MGSVTNKWSLKHLVHSNQCIVSTHRSLPVVGAYADMHRWVVTCAAYLEFFFFFLHEMSIISLEHFGAISWDMRAPGAEIYRKHYRDKKHDGSIWCYSLLFILWPDSDLIKGKMEVVSIKPILNKNFQEMFQMARNEYSCCVIMWRLYLLLAWVLMYNLPKVLEDFTCLIF